MAGSEHVPRRYIASATPAGCAAEVAGMERKSMLGGKNRDGEGKKKKKIHPDITKRTTHIPSTFLFSFPLCLLF